MNIYSLLADVVVFVHLLYMGYVVFGQLAIMIGWPLGWSWIRNFWFRSTHLLMILIVAGEAVANFQCPLTTWESDLRELAGQGRDGQGSSFTGRLLRSIQFAGDVYWPEYIDLSFYVAAALILITALVCPLRLPWRGEPAASANSETRPDAPVPPQEQAAAK